MQNVAASFTINPRNAISTEFSIDEGRAVETVFKIDAGLEIVGEGVINATKSGSVVTITSTTYIHEQGIASDMWEINHNLNKYPSVSLVDSAGTQFQARVVYIDKNKCIVTMNGATKGKAYLN